MLMFMDAPIFVKTFPWVLALAMGVLVVSGAMWRIAKGWKTKGWPHTEGKIIALALDDEIEKDTGDGTPSETHWFQVKLRYSYCVQGQEYAGNRISYAYFPSNSKTRDKHIVEKLRSKKIVRVYYDVKNPGESVLVKNTNASTYVVLLFGLLLIACSGVLWILFNCVPIDYPLLVQPGD